MIRLRSVLLIHTAAWMLFLVLPLLFMSGGPLLDNLTISALPAYLQFCGIYMLVFYLHFNWLIPRFFIQKKFVMYGLLIALLLIPVLLLKPFDDLVRQKHEVKGTRLELTSPPPPPPPDGAAHFDITSTFIFVMVIGIGSALQAIRQAQVFERRAIIAETEKVNSELAFLKAQINPHFLYNTLNNIYSLCLAGSEKAAESIMRLSHIMRYVTDESEADFVPLRDEIDCIDNFILLQKLRLGKKVTLDYVVMGDPTSHHITPLLLMTFIENTFKYGLSNHLETKVSITIDILRDRIIFKTSNRMFEHKQKPKRRGIGIENARKRLNHLYADAHSLNIDTSEGFFKVHLILYLKSYISPKLN